MINLSVLVHENYGSPQPHIYPKLLPIECSAMSEGVEIYNCDNKFSILGASFTSIVKNTRVLSHCCDITYAETVT